MQSIGNVSTPQQAGEVVTTGHSGARRATWRFVGNYLALVVAMMVGMAVVDAASRAFLTLTDLRFPAQYPELVALKMAFDGAVGMVAWLRLRRRGWAATLEVAGVMLAAPVVLFPLLWLGVLSGGSLILLEHVVVLPLIYLVMRRHRSEFGG